MIETLNKRGLDGDLANKIKYVCLSSKQLFHLLENFKGILIKACPKIGHPLILPLYNIIMEGLAQVCIYR